MKRRLRVLFDLWKLGSTVPGEIMLGLEARSELLRLRLHAQALGLTVDEVFEVAGDAVNRGARPRP